jgi:hypothetical protein
MVILTVSGKAPGKFCCLIARPFQHNPQERRNEQGHVPSEPLPENTRERQKNSPEKGKYNAEQQQDSNNQRRMQTRIVLDHIVNPVKVAQIKQKSCHPTEEKKLCGSVNTRQYEKQRHKAQKT